MKLMPTMSGFLLLLVAVPWLMSNCGGKIVETAVVTPKTDSDQPAMPSNLVNVRAEVWADNWFAFYLGETLIKEDSVPISTERSFNSETFTFTAEYPLVFNFVVKDFKENDTGLEYIGTSRQQMGDGGLIAQFVNADTGELIAVTNANWACMVVHEAPLSRDCEDASTPVAGQIPCGFKEIEEPVGWKKPGFDSSAWSPATVYSAWRVDPKGGYDDIEWDSSAELIWSADLETHNTVLCQRVVHK